jgi:hypothetical protein
MREPSPEFQRQQIHEQLVLEGQLRLRLLGEIGKYAEMSENALDEDEVTIREQLEVIEDTINALCEASRACGALVGQAT